MEQMREAAQQAWELARLPFASDAVAGTSTSADVLRAVHVRSANAVGLVSGLLNNSSCPADVISDLAGRLKGAPALLAAAHPSCPPDVAAVTFVANMTAAAVPPSLMHMPAATLSRIDARRHVWLGGASRLAGAVAVANEGFVTGPTPPDVRVWLAHRRDKDLRRLLFRPDAPSLAGRADLSEREVVTCVKKLTQQHRSSSPGAFLSRHPQLDLSVAVRLLREIDLQGRSGVLTALLLGLLAGRQAGDQRMLLRVAFLEQSADPAALDALWELSPDAADLAATLVEIASATSLVSAPSRWIESGLADRDLQWLLLCRTGAPAVLRQLSDGQLAVFSQLAPRWQGTLGAAVDVACRT